MTIKKSVFAVLVATMLPGLCQAVSVSHAPAIEGNHHFVVAPGTRLRVGDASKNEFFIIGAHSKVKPEADSPIEKAKVADNHNIIKINQALKQAFNKSKHKTHIAPKSVAQKTHPSSKHQASKAIKKKHFTEKKTKAKKIVALKKSNHSHTLHG